MHFYNFNTITIYLLLTKFELDVGIYTISNEYSSLPNKLETITFSQIRMTKYFSIYEMYL